MGERGPRARTIPEIYWKICNNTDYASIPGCNLWKGHTVAGYGSICVNGKQEFIHRFIYSQQNGVILCTDDVIRHSCDHKLCWSPEHLSKGTHADNVADKVAKGRQMRGAGHYASFLTEDNVRAIRASTETYQVLSDRYGISRGGISNIKHRKTWRHVP